MQIHWENLAALCGFDTPGRKQAAALAVSYGLAFFRRRAASRGGCLQDAPLSYPELSLPDIGGLPAAGTLVLTVNNRLARRLTLELAGLLRRAAGQRAAAHRALSAWLAESANELAFDAGGDMPAYRLDSFATQMVWTEAIRAEEAARVLLDARQAARLAMDADLLMDEWELRVPSGADTDEYKGFARWRLRYREALAELDAEDANQGYARVLDALGQAGWQRRSGWCWPASPSLAALRAPAGRVRGPGLGHRPVARRAARARAAASLRGPGSGQRVARRRELGRDAIAGPSDRSLRHRLAAAGSRIRVRPARAGPGAGRPRRRAALAFNVAVGRPLDEWPMARAALAWLRALAECADGKGCGVQTLGAALLAGHCAGDVRERSRLSAIDARWRRDAHQRVSAQEWRRQLSMAPVLAQAWNQAMDIWTQGGRKTSCDVWMPRMKAALTALGFPGEAALDSVAYQVMGALGGRWAVSRRWRRRPASWAGRPPCACWKAWPGRPPSSRSAIRRRGWTCWSLLEAEGGYWDGVWVLGLTDDVLPASPKPNPLLPLAVLRQARAPRPRRREREWAEGMYAALCRCAPRSLSAMRTWTASASCARRR